MRYTLAVVSALALASSLLAAENRAPVQPPGPPLAGTTPLEWRDDIARRLVAGVDQFLLKQLDASAAQRQARLARDFASAEAYDKSLSADRAALAKCLGARDPRKAGTAFERVGAMDRPALVARGAGYEVYAVRWAPFGDVYGEGLLLSPAGRDAVASVVAIPDADVTPEQLTGLVAGVPAECQYARRLAESGCRVVVPTLIDRRVEPRAGRAKLSTREFIYRPAFIMGRHIIGYEVQKALAAVDALQRMDARSPVGVMGWGEGGLLALYSAALDSRFSASLVSGYFADRRGIWQEPIERNVFGLLERFGDAELAAMVAPRALVVESARGPVATFGGGGAAPGRLATPGVEEVRREVERARTLVAPLWLKSGIELIASGDGTGAYGSDAALRAFLGRLQRGAELAPTGAAPRATGPLPDPALRQARQVHELDRHTQSLLVAGADRRREYMAQLDSRSVESHQATVEAYRERFAREVIGRFDIPLEPPNPRSRRIADTPAWAGYEVVLDVFDGVFAYGILLLPKDLKAGEKRPVVVCQHGLEGRPQQLISGDNPAYHDFAAKLAERGFIVFAPQNLYLFGDDFRTLQRKANPLGKTLFSIITPQHQQILRWLKTLPNVDGGRIGFYGLSYGGKTAMRVPALLPDYCLSICSADFNDWVWKNASTSSSYSYVWTGEYEIFEFDLGNTFNYAEMAALIAPRPFMVERGHFDGVAPDEAVAYEFAKVRHLYAARLGIGDRCAIEFFVGPHTIHGQGTFEFLHRHLNWPVRPAAAATGQ